MTRSAASEQPPAADAGGQRMLASSIRAVIAVALVGIWLVTLAAVAYTTANPATLNRVQLDQAGVIATASVVNEATGAIQPIRVWRGQLADSEIHVLNLPDRVVESRRYVLALRPVGRLEFEIVPAPLTEQPLVYPATHDVERQLREYLESRREGGRVGG